jgi:hypothetical protein
MNARPRILLIQLFSNGDCLYATTVARQIKHDYPDCVLIWLVAESCQNILRLNPYVDEVKTVAGINYQNWELKWEGFKRELTEIKKQLAIDRSYFTQIIDSNFANYDYCIRSTIHRGYGKPITVPLQPVLRLDPNEIRETKDFVDEHKLKDFGYVIIFEFAPRSGQAGLTADKALELAIQMTSADPTLAIIMSSNLTLTKLPARVIDGSKLSLRQTAHLSHYADLLVGCSSGITWVTTSEAGRPIPMIQLLDPHTYWLNSVAHDRARYGLPADDIIEMPDSKFHQLQSCVSTIRSDGFSDAKRMFHVDIPQSFRVSRGLIFYLLKKGYLRGVIRHIRINVRIFGWHPRLIRSICLGIFTFPVMLIKKKLDARKQ